MIIVTGATGHLGHAIVEALLASGVPTHQVGVSVRDPQKAAGLEARGVRVRRGDFAEPASLAHAFEGATQVLLVSSNAAAYGGDTLAQHRAAMQPRATRARGASFTPATWPRAAPRPSPRWATTRKRRRC